MSTGRTWPALKGCMRLLRVRQWVKNGFVLAPLLFSGRLHEGAALLEASLAMLQFCLVSSAVYICNDLGDRDLDRKHPLKSKTRPLASGEVTTTMAVALLLLLLGVLGLTGLCQAQVLPIAALYLALNLAYTVALKHVPVVDLHTIAAGFVMRVHAGAVAIDVPVSGWMFVTTFCLALFLAAIKRRQELAQSGPHAREVLAKYSPALIDRYAEMSGSGALMFYGMFVMSARPQLVPTIPLVLFGLFRYWYRVDASGSGESPTDALLDDKPLMGIVLAWAAACAWLLWPRSA